jgi:hypothetical protein
VTQIEVVNVALSWCGTERVTDLVANAAAGIKAAQVALDNWQTAYEAVLADREWTFAKDRVVLALDAAAPVFGYDKKYIIPSTVVKVWRVYDSTEALSEDWVREGGYVLCDDVAPVYAEVSIKADVALWSGIALQALEAKLAATMAIPLTENRQLRVDLEALYKEFIKVGGSSDGQQGRSRVKTVPRMAGRRR